MEPPAHAAAAGRFNKVQAPLLYSCIGLPVDTLTEARVVEPGSHFILIGYEVIDPLRVKRVGISHDPSLTMRQQRIETKISEFLAQIVSVPAHLIGAATYERTQHVLREFYMLEDQWESGWIYRSTLADPETWHGSLEPLNLALEPQDAHAKLQVRHVLSGTQFGYQDAKHHIGLHAFSDAESAQDGYLEFEAFPHSKFSNLQEYFDFLD